MPGPRLESILGHCERHALLHMAHKWFDHWTTWAGLVLVGTGPMCELAMRAWPVPCSYGVYMHLYVPSLLLLTSASVRVADGAVTNAFTLPPPRGATEPASTVNSVVDSRYTPEYDTVPPRTITHTRPR